MLGDVACMALAIYFEARSEDFVGKVFVAETIMNRVESKRYKNNVCDVVMQYKQFSFLNDMYDKGEPLKISEGKAWEDAVMFSYKYVYNRPNNVHNSCHYATNNVNNKWTRQYEKVIQIGAHSFYDGGC